MPLRPREPTRPCHRVVATLAGLVLLAACTATPRDPSGLLQPRDAGRQTSTSGSSAVLVGTWRATIFIALEGDFQSWVTTWRFEADGRCHFRQDVTSTLEGTTRSRERSCTWTTAGGILRVIHADNGEARAMPYSFQPFGATVLVLEGIEHRRVSG
jgi:hypothetical protein